MSISQYPSLRVNGGELNWDRPDKDSTFDQVEIYSSTAKYGTYSLLATITDIHTLYYVDSSTTISTWYKIRFKDSTNTLYSQYSLPKSADGRISDTNYTTPRKVAAYLGAYRRKVAESLGTGDDSETDFDFPTGDNLPIEETEYVYVAGVLKQRNVDYTIDYDLGKVTFGTAPASSAAITATYWASTFASNETYIDSIRGAEQEINRQLGRTFYGPRQVTEYIDSYDPVDTDRFNFEESSYGSDANDYQPNTFTDLTSRVLKLTNFPVISVQQVITNAQPTDVSSEAVGTGDAATKAFTLDYTKVVYDSEEIYLDGVQTTGYTINYSTGAITFTSAPGLGVAVTANYTYCDDGNIIASSNYLLRDKSGLIILKSSETALELDPFVCAVTYTHGYYETQYLVQKLATKLAAVDLLQTTQMSTDSPLSVTSANLGAILGEISSHYKSLGKKLTATRI